MPENNSDDKNINNPDNPQEEGEKEGISLNPQKVEKAMTDLSQAFEQLKDLFGKDGPMSKLNEVMPEINNVLGKNPSSGLGSLLSFFSNPNQNNTNSNTPSTDNSKDSNPKQGPTSTDGNKNLKYKTYKVWQEGSINFILDAESSGGLYGQWKGTLIGTNSANNADICFKSEFTFNLIKNTTGYLKGAAQVSVSNDVTPSPVLCDLNFSIELSGTTEVTDCGNDKWKLTIKSDASSMTGNLNITAPNASMNKNLPLTKGSEWTVVSDIEKVTATFEKDKNDVFHDSLPVIPKGWRQATTEIIRYKQNMKLILKLNGKPAEGLEVTIKSSNSKDEIRYINQISDSDGVIKFIIERPGISSSQLSIEDKNNEVYCAPYTIDFKEAWYEELFAVTHYYIPKEQDFIDGKDTFDKVKPGLEKCSGLKDDDMHDAGFKSATLLNGTGVTKDGDFIRHDSSGYYYADRIGGTQGELTPNLSIAVDPLMIPMLYEVSINNKTYIAHDTGSKIKNNHIDVYVGIGIEKKNTFQDFGSADKNTAEVTSATAKVKFLGVITQKPTSVQKVPRPIHPIQKD